MKKPKLAGQRMFNRVVISTALPNGKMHRLYYHAPVGGAIVPWTFPMILKQHRDKLAGLGVTFREVQTGPNSFMFVHPDRDKKEIFELGFVYTPHELNGKKVPLPEYQ